MTSFDTLRSEPDILSFSAGEKIIQEGETGDYMYAVLDGDVEIVKNGKVLEVISSGGMFGELALIDKQPRNASAVAKTDCQLVRINEERFVALVHHTPHFALQVMRVMADRIRYRASSVV